MISGDTADNSGVALFNAQNVKQDAVGFATGAASLRQGSGFPNAPTGAGQSAWMRDFIGTLPKQSADSSQDFVFIATNGASVGGTPTAVVAQLGSPNPEGLTSPNYVNHLILTELFDTGTPQPLPPNRVRSGSGDSGSVLVRRTITNNTGRDISKLRLTVTRITSQRLFEKWQCLDWKRTVVPPQPSHKRDYRPLPIPDRHFVGLFK